ncbi:STAS domain-containing protein [Paenibacillus filicis]|uniref:Anti-sigma factor antagonist n=2 Tax=Paenibacillus gyeongsangnamensis TaxID=3388067 RepID=A0ABT4QH74_9BACL|nr:STAS domain-containing protein [Paenibacillus filicis]MCZ8516219.1 STAS domain-containing protein [Paenibacillus filicis]
MTHPSEKFHYRLLSTPEANVLFVEGELDLGTVEQFRAAVEPLAADKEKLLKLNLRELSYVDSTGIGIFVAALKTRQGAGSGLSVQEVPPKIRRLFDLTGLSKFLTIEGGS